MPIVSKVTLPSGNEYNLRDNSQGNSDHQHYYTNLVPLVHKVYESTSYYATSGTTAKSTWYFASVKPDDWYKPWRVRFKYHTYCTANAAQHSYTLSTVCGRSDGSIYANFNEVQTSAHYYTSIKTLKKAGFDYGLGHAIGISIYGSSNYTKSAYYRTFEIDYIECENCTVTILDTPVLWENWQNGTTTYYNDLVNQDAVSRGLQETGDANTTTENRISYFAGKTGSKGVWAYGLFMEDQYGTFQNICTGSDGTVTANTRTTATTKIANTNGFKVCGTIFYTNTTYNANTNISGSGNVYSSISVFDTRYSFNTTLTAGFLTAYKPLYLVGTIHDDGLFYLDTVWWTQTPTDTSKVYILVGGVFDSSTSYCRATLYEQNKWYRYDGTMLIEISNDAITVNGHTVESDVPENAKFTDTTYAVYKTLASYVEPSENISTDDITSWSAGTVTTASVSGQTLVITTGTAPSLSYTSRSIPTYNITNKLVVNDVYELGPTETKKTVDFTPIISVDDAVAKNAVSTLLKFSPKQSGSGDPSPINIRPIVPWTEASLTGAGKNLIPDNAKEETSATVARWMFATGFVLRKGVTYTLSSDNLSTTVYITKKSDNSTIIYGSPSATYTPLEDMLVYFRAYLSPSISDVSIQLELGSTATTYEPYIAPTTLTISLGGTYYGFSVDIERGVLRALYGAKDMGSLTWRKASGEGHFYCADNLTRFPYKMSNDLKILCSCYKNDGIGSSASGYYGDDGTFRYYYTGNEFATARELYISDNARWAIMTVEEFTQAVTGQYVAYELAEPYEILLTPQTVSLLSGTNTLWSNGDEVSLTYIATDSQ